MDFQDIIEALFSALIMPLQLVLVPIDAMLENIDGIDLIPNMISSLSSFIGSIPQTIVVMFGISPLLWNLTFTIFILYIGLAPAVNGIKKVIAWIT